MTDDLSRARYEGVDEVARAMMVAAGEALMRHGEDPLSEAILGAAVLMFVDTCDGLRPGFKGRMIKILEAGAPT